MWSVAISGPPNVGPVICICGGLTIKEAELLPDVEVDVSMKELAVGTAKESSSPPSSIWYYLPTPPLGQDMTQGQFLSGV